MKSSITKEWLARVAEASSKFDDDLPPTGRPTGKFIRDVIYENVVTKESLESFAQAALDQWRELMNTVKPCYDVHTKLEDAVARKCAFCGKEPPPYNNYCNWECQIGLAKSLGGKVITPNGLPIACIKANNDMLEDAHADHPDYKFPVEVKYIGTEFYIEDEVLMFGRDLTEAERLRSRDETHALIYTDGCVAVTMYECCYAFFYLRDGKLAGGSCWQLGDYELAPESRSEIVDRLVLNTPYSRPR